MSDIATFTLDDNEVINVEVVEPRGDEYQKISRAAVNQAPSKFSDAIKRIRPAAEEIIGQLRDLTQQPDEVEIEFGIKLSAKLGAFIAATSTDANFNVRMNWKKGVAG